MAVQQVTFNIPSEIEKGLEEGILFRYGGVIRDTIGSNCNAFKRRASSQDKRKCNFRFC